MRWLLALDNLTRWESGSQGRRALHAMLPPTENLSSNCTRDYVLCKLLCQASPDFYSSLLLHNKTLKPQIHAIGSSFTKEKAFPITFQVGTIRSCMYDILQDTAKDTAVLDPTSMNSCLPRRTRLSSSMERWLNSGERSLTWRRPWRRRSR